MVARWAIASDGGRIAYQDDDSIYVVDLFTREPSNVADGDNAEWLDDETLIVTPPWVKQSPRLG